MEKQAPSFLERAIERNGNLPGWAQNWTGLFAMSSIRSVAPRPLPLIPRMISNGEKAGAKATLHSFPLFPLPLPLFLLFPQPRQIVCTAEIALNLKHFSQRAPCLSQTSSQRTQR